MEIFDDIIFRKEDVISSCRFVPGDCVSFGFKAEEHLTVYVVRDNSFEDETQS